MPAAKKTTNKPAKKPRAVFALVEGEPPLVAPKPRKKRRLPTFAFALLDEQDAPGAITGPYADQASMLEDIAMSASGKSVKVVTYREAKRGTLTLSAKIA